MCIGSLPAESAKRATHTAVKGREMLAQTAGTKKQFQTPYGAIEIFISILSQCEKCCDIEKKSSEQEKCWY